MFCPNCGGRIEENKETCLKCGTIIGTRSEAEKIQVGESGTAVKEDASKVIIKTVSEANESVPSINNETIPSTYENNFNPAFLYKGIVIGAGICSILAIIMIFSGGFRNSEFQYRFLITMICTFILGVANVNYSNLYEKGKSKLLSLIGMLLSVIVFFTYVLNTWGFLTIESQMVEKVMSSMIVACVAIYHASYILLLDIKNNISKIFYDIANVLIFITYSLIVVRIFTEIQGEFIIKMFATLLVLTVFTSIATPLLNRANK